MTTGRAARCARFFDCGLWVEGLLLGVGGRPRYRGGTASGRGATAWAGKPMPLRSEAMDENARIAAVGMLAPAVIGGMAGIGAGVLERVGGTRAPSVPRFSRDTSPARAGEEAGEEFIGGRVLAVVGVTMAMFVALFGIYGMPGWPPASSVDRLFLLPPGIGLVGLGGVLITAWRGKRSPGGERRLGWMVSSAAAGIGAAIGAAVALGPSFWNGKMMGMGGITGLVWVPLVFGVWSAVSAWAVGRLVRGGNRDATSAVASLGTSPARAGEEGWAKSAAVVLVGLCAAVGAGLLGTGSKDLGLDGFACAAASAGLVIGLLIVRGSAGPGAIGVVCGMLGALLACGVMLSSTPWWVVGVLGCVAPAAVLADVVIGRKLGSVGGAAVRVGAAVMVATLAVGPGMWSLVKFARETQGSE